MTKFLGGPVFEVQMLSPADDSWMSTLAGLSFLHGLKTRAKMTRVVLSLQTSDGPTHYRPSHRKLDEIVKPFAEVIFEMLRSVL